MMRFGNISMVFSYLTGSIKKNPTICLSYGGEGYKDGGICDV